MTNDELRELIALLDQRFAAVDQRFAAVDQRFDAVDRRFDRMDRQFTAVAHRFDALEREMHERFAGVDGRFGEMIGHFDRVYGWLEKLEQERVVTNTLMKRLESRLDETAEALNSLGRRMTEALTSVVDQQAVMSGTLLQLSTQQAATTEVLRRLEARG